MEKKSPPWTLAEVATIVGGELYGPADLVLTGVTSTLESGSNRIAFAESPAFIAEAETTGVGALLVVSNATTSLPHIKVASPRQAFGQLLHLAQRELPLGAGIHATAVVSPDASVDASASIGAYAVIEAGVTIGAGTKVYSFVYIGENCVVGPNCKIYPHAVLVQDVTLGSRCLVNPGAVIGGDGFGFYWDGKNQRKIPQIGAVRIGDDCEVGSLTAIDRATAGATVLAKGVKLDNFIQIAHNVRIGEDTVIAAHTALAGSCKVGARVTMGGKVDVNNQVTVCDDAVFGGRAGIAQDITEPGTYFGLPAKPIREATRVMMMGWKLPEYVDRIKSLEKRLEELEKK